jgi:hypothetical protein
MNWNGFGSSNGLIKTLSQASQFCTACESILPFPQKVSGLLPFEKKKKERKKENGAANLVNFIKSAY